MVMCPSAVKNMENDRNLKDLKKANHLACSNDCDYQNQNFLVSKIVVCNIALALL